MQVHYTYSEPRMGVLEIDDEDLESETPVEIVERLFPEAFDITVTKIEVD